MKLLLCSEGFYTEEEIAKTEELVGKPRAEIGIAIINEAYAVEKGGHRWVIETLAKVGNIFGGHIELVNLLALDLSEVKQRIELCDVIFVVGGHTDYLMYVFQKSGFDRLLPDLLRTKVYVGSSAGSMVAARRMSTKAYEMVYGEEGDYGVTHYFNFVDFALKPHFGSPLFKARTKEQLLEASKGYVGTVYGLDDNTAMVIEDDKVHPIGGKPIKIVDGELSEDDDILLRTRAL
ncbi:MAG TPA: Type 1 glutamine amidotransferase-like domain-containing protein [Candidatus Saccharimonadales bacterium]